MSTVAPPADVATFEDLTDTPIKLTPGRTTQDVIFRAVLVSAASMVVIFLVAIVAYLIINSWDAVHHAGFGVFGSEFSPPAHLGLIDLVEGSLVVALIALVIAFPVSVASALMINEYSPRKIRPVLISLIDLLAALPSIVYGLWGLIALTTYLYGPTVWLSHHANAIPLFRDPDQTFGNSLFICGIVVGIMVIPIITSVTREVMSQAPRDVCEASLALGGTRWGMVSDVLLPFSKFGIVGATLLGLGRALGETIAVLIILSPSDTLWYKILHPGGATVAQTIALLFTSVTRLSESALVLAGLFLFVTVLMTNIAARVIVNRSQARLA